MIFLVAARYVNLHRKIKGKKQKTPLVCCKYSFRLLGFLRILFVYLEVCHPSCVCENWKGYAVKHNYVNLDVLMTILDNYMFRPLLAIFRLSSREPKVLTYLLHGAESFLRS